MCRFSILTAGDVEGLPSDGVGYDAIMIDLDDKAKARVHAHSPVRVVLSVRPALSAPVLLPYYVTLYAVNDIYRYANVESRLNELAHHVLRYWYTMKFPVLRNSINKKQGSWRPAKPPRNKGLGCERGIS